MNANNSELLTTFLLSPSVAKNYSATQWQQLLQQCYATNLVARVYFFLTKNNLFEYVPQTIQWHFHSAYVVATTHKSDVLNEVEQLNKALALANIQPVFLKGAAYLLAQDTCMNGRVFSDVDLFVEKKHIAAVEQVLRWHGWQSEELDEHDQKYYRQWMHEIPPMRNSRTNMTVDVHHNLLPLVSRINLNSEQLLTAIESHNQGKTLSLADRVLHSTVHLLLDGEFKHGYRDLHDIYLLIHDGLSVDSDFLMVLCTRAKELNFQLLLFYCLVLQQKIFSLPITKKTLTMLLPKQRKFSSWLTIKLLLKVISPNNILNKPFKYHFALFLLFIRSHWLKMPITLLVPHLFHKAFITPYIARKKSQEFN